METTGLFPVGGVKKDLNISVRVNSVPPNLMKEIKDGCQTERHLVAIYLKQDRNILPLYKVYPE